MIRGTFKLIFGIVGAVIITGIIVFVTFAIGRAVTGTWDITKWGEQEEEPSSVVTEYDQLESDIFDGCFYLTI